MLYSGVNAGYVLIVSGVLAMGLGLNVLVVLQQLSWAVTVGLCSFTVVKITRRTWVAVPAVILGGYPGIQIYGNLLMSESTFVCCVTNATCLLLLARQAASPRLKLGGIVGAIMFATLAAVTKAQGAGVVLLVAAIGVATVYSAGWRYSFSAFAAGITSLCVVVGANLVRDASLDRTSRLFGAKTLFCSHLDIVMNSSSVERLAKDTFGASAPEILETMREMRYAGPTVFPTLGFNADECQHNPSFDNLAESANPRGTNGLRDWYLKALRAAIFEHPTQYLQKVVRQITYGLRMSVPPHGLGQNWTGVPERQQLASQMLEGHAHATAFAASPYTIRAGWLARLESFSSYSLRAMSLLTGSALLLSVVAVFWPAYRNGARSIATGAAVAALVWWSQTLAIAASHTLDVWRYVIPVVPSAIICLLLFTCASLSMITRRDGAWSRDLERKR